MVTRSA